MNLVYAHSGMIFIRFHDSAESASAKTNPTLLLAFILLQH